MFIPGVAAMNVLTAPLLIGLTTGLWTGIFILSGSADSGCVAFAQVTSDGTLSTAVTQTGNNFAIDNGDRAGNNLFHSFSQFSVPTGGSAVFNNAADIQNIFSRVTGGSLSNIDGLIQANGTANLFLLNPSGILFGPNAALNIGGSFIGTTADSVKFADGVEFSAVNANGSPLLTMRVPIGLQMGQNPGAITVRGTGHRITTGVFTPFDRSNNPVGLQVSTGNTLALIGGAVNFSGGIVAVNGAGHLEVGSVSNGQVRLNPTGQGWVGDYSAVSQFNDIHLAQQSLLDASGSNGSIQVQGRNITLSEGSALLIQNLGAQPSGNITVHAMEALNLTGTIPNGSAGSAIRTENLGRGQAGDINLFAAQLSIQNGGIISNNTFSPAPSGNVTVNVSGAIAVDGFAPANPALVSSISTGAFSSANAGNITVSTGSLRLLNASSIASFSLSSGQSGTIRVNAQDLIEIAGNNPVTLTPSALSSAALGSGNANSLFVNTSRLVIRDGGLFGSTTLSMGSSGSVTVNASESIDIQGRAAGSIAASRIASTAEILDPATQAAFRLPAIPSGNAGSLTINTPSLRITDGAYMTVKNDGPGRAGDLLINANSIFLENQGAITASTASGNGGDVRLNLQNYLLMRHNSLISATAVGNGNGGNLSINAPVIVGLENSDIITNAVQGRGGNINITTQGIIGLEFRNTLTPRADLTNDITASSEFNVNGTVQINNIGVDPNSGLVNLPVDLADPTRQVAQGCAANQGSSFMITGRGGIPPNPMTQTSSDRPWTDTRDLAPYRSQPATPPSQATIVDFPLIQATGWRRNAQGLIELYAETPSTAAPLATPMTCAGAKPFTAIGAIATP
jgi:filamentous hemagglutinin family protein